MGKPAVHINDHTKAGKRDIINVLIDIKSLVKGKVLIANVLPVLTGFLLVLYFTNATLKANLDLFIFTMIGSTLTIAGALIINNWYEVDLDREMTRTKQRPTVTGNFSMNAVLAMGISASVIGLLIMLLTTMEAFIYAFLGWFIYVVLYTFWSKRRYTLNTVIGSVSGAFTPMIGWAAIDSAFHIIPIVLFILLFIWQVPHTFAIAMRRYHEYKAAGVPMLPVVYGFEVTKRQTFIYIVCLFPLPFLMSIMGTTFVVLTTILNIVWIVLGFSGFYMKDDIKWANLNFYYSLAYLNFIFIMLILISWIG